MKINTLIVLYCSFFLLIACHPGEAQSNEKPKKYTTTSSTFDEKIDMSDEEWKVRLTPQEYRVLREKGTERSFSGDLLRNKEKGVYVCGACGLELFDANSKFTSGTGWPSFFQPINTKNVGEVNDSTLGMRRTEVVCNRCDGHLGHVFEDGPKPTGLRYCINSISLDFVPEKSE